MRKPYKPKIPNGMAFSAAKVNTFSLTNENVIQKKKKKKITVNLWRKKEPDAKSSQNATRVGTEQRLRPKTQTTPLMA